MIIYIDIDETICKTPEDRDYSKSKPIENNIQKANKLYDDGHTIVYWTARGTVTGIDWTETTQKQFKKWGVKHHELKMGKPYYDVFIDAMEDFYAPESGNSGDKLVLASRKVLAYLNKLGSNGFLNNSIGASSYKIDMQNIQGQFGHEVTKINTIFGNLHFVAEPLFRGQDENLAIAIDLANVKYRPLQGNGVSRDTHILTNIQNNNVDGRKDMVMTEAGLEISLPETHAVMKFS